MTNHTGIAAGQYSRNPVVVRLPCSHRGLSHVPWKPNRYFFGAMSLVPGDRGLPSSYRPSAPASRGSGRRNRGSFVRTAAGCSARRVPPRCVPASGRYTCARPGTRAPSTVAASATHLPDRPLANRVCSPPHCRSPWCGRARRTRCRIRDPWLPGWRTPAACEKGLTYITPPETRCRRIQPVNALHIVCSGVKYISPTADRASNRTAYGSGRNIRWRARVSRTTSSTNGYSTGPSPMRGVRPHHGRETAAGRSSRWSPAGRHAHGNGGLPWPCHRHAKPTRLPQHRRRANQSVDGRASMTGNAPSGKRPLQGAHGRQCTCRPRLQSPPPGAGCSMTNGRPGNVTCDTPNSRPRVNVRVF